jgi:hypothetical protein
MTTAGIRGVLRATPYSADITLNTQTSGLSSQVVQNVHGQFDSLFHQYLGDAVDLTQASITNNDFAFSPSRGNSSVTIYGTSMQQAAPHLQILQGQLARIHKADSANTLEVMMTPDTAQSLHLRVGSTFSLSMQYLVIPSSTDINAGSSTQHATRVTARVAGLFSVPTTHAAYWQGNDFKTMRYAVEGGTSLSQYTLLVPNTELLALFDSLCSLNHVDAIHSVNYSGYGLTWHYTLNASRQTNNTLDTTIHQLTLLQSDISSSYGDIQNTVSNDNPLPYPFLMHVDLAGQLLASNSLQQFRSRVAVAQIPSGVFALLILALILFFVSLLASLLVEQQSRTIAIVRSRGASSNQVFSALLLQSAILAIIALLIGIPAALGIVFLFAQHTLPAIVLDSLNVVTHNPLQAITNILWYAIAVVLVALCTISISLFFAARTNVLSLRRETARSGRRPLWQRFNLDIRLWNFCVHRQHWSGVTGRCKSTYRYAAIAYRASVSYSGLYVSIFTYLPLALTTGNAPSYTRTWSGIASGNCPNFTFTASIVAYAAAASSCDSLCPLHAHL